MSRQPVIASLFRRAYSFVKRAWFEIKFVGFIVLLAIITGVIYLIDKVRKA